MRLHTAALAAVVACVACRSAEHPPDEGGIKAGEWRVQDVPECGFSIEVPDFAQRDDLAMEKFPDVIDVGYHTRMGLAVQCTVYPPSWQLPPAPDLLKKELDRKLLNMEGLAGGVVDHQLTIDDSGAAATYTVRFANGVMERGRYMIVGRQVHELGAAIGKGRSTEADLARLIASYKRR